MGEATVVPTVMLLSPANLGGRRGQMLLNPKAQFGLAKRLQQAPGAPLGDLFSLVSGLYFRGKLSYARAFARAPSGSGAIFVMTAGGGLCSPDEPVDHARLSRWANVSITQRNPHFTVPLTRHASALCDECASNTRFVLLGSIASPKYVEPLLSVFGPRLLFPARFAGLGDMSRGSLLLKAVRENSELQYQPVLQAWAHDIGAVGA